MMDRRRRSAIAAIGLLTGLLPASAGVALAADPVTVTFGYTGAEQTFVVPDDVTSLHVVLVGGRGGNAGDGTPGGSGARVEGDLPVLPGAILFVSVGGNGTTGGTIGVGGFGGFNGGGLGGDTPGLDPYGAGGGGGATDLRSIPRAAGGSLASRRVVAAGGGGGGYGAPGGDAGQPGNGTSVANGGAAGTALGPGQGGTGQAGWDGLDGVVDTGGRGAHWEGPGGGGGGGLFGGGGGGGGFELEGGSLRVGLGAGGGGGSSFTGSLANSSVTIDSTGVPSVAITYLPGSGLGTVFAQVTVPTSSACLELSTSSIDFGTLPLGATHQPASPVVTVTNCSGADESVYASATDAYGPGAYWALTDDPAGCADALGLDAYRLRLESDSDGVQLRTLNKPVGLLASGDSQSHTALIDMACPGSTGSGVTMTFSITFLAGTF